MENGDSAVKKFLGDVEEEKNQDLFKIEDTPPQEENQEEMGGNDNGEEDEDKVPFHKNPKITKYLAKREKQIEDRLTAKFASNSEQKKNIEDDDIEDLVDSWTAIIGNDTPEKIRAIDSLRKSLNKYDERATQKALSKIQEIENEQYEADQEAEQELEDAFDEIEDTYNVDFSSQQGNRLRVDFINYVEKIAPKRNGVIVDYPDMINAWETFSEMRKSSPVTSKAKGIASRSLSRSSNAAPVKTEHATWDKVDEMIDSLK